MEIRYFDDHSFQFIKNLERATQAKYQRVFRLLEIYGHALSMPHVKKIDTQIYELRIRGRQEVRIFFTYCNSGIVFLSGFIKKSQRIPLLELSLARYRLQCIE